MTTNTDADRAEGKQFHRIRIVSDVICPWCYIGKRRLEEALRRLPGDSAPEIVWSAFELNPEMPAEGIERKVYRSAKFGSLEKSEALDAEVAGVGRNEGIIFNFTRIARTPNTIAAHRLIWFAKQFEKQSDMVEELFRRYFVEGQDIGDPEVLIAAASEHGIPNGIARAFLTSDRGLAEVAGESEAARARGISGVPTFILNDCLAVSGAQTPDFLLSAFRRAGESQSSISGK
jgi:predicted DsbA family dithiol-disulfide isomerase